MRRDAMIGLPDHIAHGSWSVNTGRIGHTSNQVVPVALHDRRAKLLVIIRDHNGKNNGKIVHCLCAFGSSGVEVGVEVWIVQAFTRG